MRKNRRIIQILVASALSFSFMIPTLAAPSVDEAQEKKEELEGKLDSVEEQLETIKEKSSDTQEYLDKLDEQLAGLSTQLVSLEQQLTATEEELTATQLALNEAKVTKDKQYEDMKKRIKFMYENGDTAYLEMILEADNFTDMINKADYVKAISEYDRNMLTEFQNTVKDISEKEAQVQAKCTEIENLKAGVEEQKESVEALTATKKKEMESYKKEIAKSKELKEEYEAEIEEQEALIARIEEEAARKAEEEARKKREEEERKAAEAKKAAEEARKNASVSSVTGSSETTSSKEDETENTVSATGWTWPLPGQTRITSDYGWRLHPTLGYNKFHNGIDVGAPTGTPIVAANSGTVIAADYNSTMGNYVMIDHGNGITTIYMHCSALNTSYGKSVKSGQTIAYVGSTGRSTGPHLHFGVRVSGSYVSPWSYVSK